jgi:rubrerythrin
MISLKDLQVCSQCGTVYSPTSHLNFGKCPVCKQFTMSDSITA